MQNGGSEIYYYGKNMTFFGSTGQYIDTLIISILILKLLIILTILILILSIISTILMTC